MNHLFRNRFLLWVKPSHELQTKLLSSSWTQLSPEMSSASKTSAAPVTEESDPLTDSLSPMSAMSSLISSDEIRNRQKNLLKVMDRCSYSGHKQKLILISGSSRPLLADTKIPSTHFKQNSDFIYLTGFASKQSSDCVLALIGGNGEPIESIFFAPFMDSTQQLWDGNDIREHSLWIHSICDDFRDISQMNELIGSQTNCRQLFASKSGLSNGNSSSVNSTESCDKLSPHLSNYLNLNTNSTVHNCSKFVDQLRLIKSESESNSMRRVCRIGSQAMHNSMVWAKRMAENTLINESQIAAKFEFESYINGARKLSFPTVCGSGHRSSIIHYGANNQYCSANDWVLMDAGCEDVDGYNSDLTRTWPINGNFRNHRLRHDLYEALCEVQSDLISALSNDPMMTLDLLFRLMSNLIANVLIDFKVMDITLSAQEAVSLAHKFCPHHVSHYLGLDVHDCPTMSRNIRLKPGMCFTVEPGLYFHKSYPVKPEFKGIGMRVEDDLIVNSDGQIEVLTKDCPHEPNL